LIQQLIAWIASEDARKGTHPIGDAWMGGLIPAFLTPKKGCGCHTF